MTDPSSSTFGQSRVASRPATAEQAPSAAQVGPAKRHRFLYGVLAVSLLLNATTATIYAMRVSRKGGMRYLLERLDLRDAEHETVPFQAEWRAQVRKLPN